MDGSEERGVAAAGQSARRVSTAMFVRAIDRHASLIYSCTTATAADATFVVLLDDTEVGPHLLL